MLHIICIDDALIFTLIHHAIMASALIIFDAYHTKHKYLSRNLVEILVFIITAQNHTQNKKRLGLTYPSHFLSAADRGRTGTGISSHGILSPGRLPIPPQRHICNRHYYIIICIICQWYRRIFLHLYHRDYFFSVDILTTRSYILSRASVFANALRL